jgi:hypothetical protein
MNNARLRIAEAKRKTSKSERAIQNKSPTSDPLIMNTKKIRAKPPALSPILAMPLPVAFEPLVKKPDKDPLPLPAILKKETKKRVKRAKQGSAKHKKPKSEKPKSEKPKPAVKTTTAVETASTVEKKPHLTLVQTHVSIPTFLKHENLPRHQAITLHREETWFDSLSFWVRQKSQRLKSLFKFKRKNDQSNTIRAYREEISRLQRENDRLKIALQQHGRKE